MAVVRFHSMEPLTDTLERKPQGFDSGLKCLTAVALFTIAVKILLRLVNYTHSRALISLALAVVFIGLAALFVTCYIVWSRRNERQYPPRCWAVVVALVWVSLQIFTYVLFWALSQRP